eukprot:g2161.t1
MVGPEHVMGLAIGNELELLHNHVKSEACVTELFSGRLWRTFQDRVAEFEAWRGFSAIPVTSVFTASILTDRVQVPFMEDPATGLVNSFLVAATRKYGKRYAFTFNVYPYFDPGIHLNPGTTDGCSLDLPRVICWDQANCLGPNIMAAARRQMLRLTGRTDDLFWIGEIGWSSPRADALGTAMADCEEFSSLETFQTFYEPGMQWNLQIPGGLPGPDHAFYFTLRDALNFGQQDREHQSPMTWQGWAFVALGVILALCIAFTCLYVRSPTVKTLGQMPKGAARTGSQGLRPLIQMLRGIQGLVALLSLRVCAGSRVIGLTEDRCMACRLLMPELEKVAETMAKDRSMLVAQCDVSKESRLAEIYRAWRTPLVMLFPDTRILLPGLQAIFNGQLQHASLVSFTSGPWPLMVTSRSELQEVVQENGRSGTFVGFFRSPQEAGPLQELWPLDCLRRHHRTFAFARWGNESTNESEKELWSWAGLDFGHEALQIKEVQEAKSKIALGIEEIKYSDPVPEEAIVYVRSEDACHFAPSGGFVLYQEGGSAPSKPWASFTWRTEAPWRDQVEAFCAWCERQVLSPAAVFDATRAAALDGTFDWLLLLFAPKSLEASKPLLPWYYWLAAFLYWVAMPLSMLYISANADCQGGPPDVGYLVFGVFLTVHIILVIVAMCQHPTPPGACDCSKGFFLSGPLLIFFMILDHMDMATDAMFVGTAAACSPMIENAYVQSWAAIPVIGAELKFTIEDTRQVTSSLCGGQQNQIPPSQGQLGALPLGAGACF